MRIQIANKEIVCHLVANSRNKNETVLSLLCIVLGFFSECKNVKNALLKPRKLLYNLHMKLFLSTINPQDLQFCYLRNKLAVSEGRGI